MQPTPQQTPDDQPDLTAAELRNLMSRLLRRLRRPDGMGALTGAQKNVLSRLDQHGPLGISELARQEGVRPQSMGATVTSLEEGGLLSRSPSTDDRRKTLLSLTPRAQDLFTSGRAFRQDWLKAALGQELTPDELVQVRQAIALLSRIIPED